MIHPLIAQHEEELVVSQPTIEKLRHPCLGVYLRQGSAFVEAAPEHHPETCPVSTPQLNDLRAGRHFAQVPLFVPIIGGSLVMPWKTPSVASWVVIHVVGPSDDLYQKCSLCLGLQLHLVQLSLSTPLRIPTPFLG